MKVKFTPFRSGEYSIDNFTFQPGINEVPDEILSSEPYQKLQETGAIESVQEPADASLSETETTPKFKKVTPSDK